MKPNQPHDDTPLKTVLQQWNVKSPLPPRFSEQVWHRIERSETASAPSISLATLCANWIATRLPRPALATAYVTVLLAIGAGVGWNQARHDAARITSDLSARYVQAVDPYQATR